MSHSSGLWLSISSREIEAEAEAEAVTYAARMLQGDSLSTG